MRQSKRTRVCFICACLIVSSMLAVTAHSVGAASLGRSAAVMPVAPDNMVSRVLWFVCLLSCVTWQERP